MNTSFKFLIPTIFITLGFMISCNDDMTSAGEEYDGNNNNPNVATSSNPDPPDNPDADDAPIPNVYYDSDKNPENFNFDEIDPEDLSIKIKEIGVKIEELEEDRVKYFDEYNKLAEIQKDILDQMTKNKMIMRLKPLGSEEQIRAEKEFENKKKLGKEKLKVLKEKNIFLHKLLKTITDTKDEEMTLRKKQEFFYKKRKEKERRMYKERKKMNQEKMNI
ncbi:hypothetical protein G9C01_02505 [Blattabacterium sp. DPU]|uniref:hypothetical protein n=1 Tax=Blattabacterium sp. DPU TaxID=2715232 RepID=UPI00140CAE74|nr:hypothetical protein [Blattabacterium sp. DPU]QIK16792.1 hypothetical protein G9C01_02505 [Blattabacterium sp. DPU]